MRIGVDISTSCLCSGIFTVDRTQLTLSFGQLVACIAPLEMRAVRSRRHGSAKLPTGMRFISGELFEAADYLVETR